MEQQVAYISIAAALAWASGIRLYAVLFLVGLAGHFHWTGWDTPSQLAILSHPIVLGANALLLLVEFFADKIPGVDSIWDLLHTVLRVPVGAFLAAAAMSPDGELGAGMLATGAGVALTSHVIKAGSRALLNTSPEPVSNWTASVTEDAAVVGGLALAFTHPWLALAIVVAISLLFAFSVWWLWRRLFRRAPRPELA